MWREAGLDDPGPVARRFEVNDCLANGSFDRADHDIAMGEGSIELLLLHVDLGVQPTP